MHSKVHNVMAWRQDIFCRIIRRSHCVTRSNGNSTFSRLPRYLWFIRFCCIQCWFFLFGSNRYLSCGADSTIAPIFAVSLAGYAALFSAQYMALASLLALLVGGILLAVYIFKLGWVANLLSYPVTLGFLAGVSIHIIVSQLSFYFRLTA